MKFKARKKKQNIVMRLLRSRKIIVVSDDSVEYYPLNRTIQVVGILGVLSVVSWVSYATGGLMAVEAQMEEKDRELQTVSMENEKMENEFALLKRDLVRVQKEDGKGDLSEYAQFVLDQYETDAMAGVRSFAYGNNKADGTNNMVFERMGFLEKRVQQLKEEKAELISEIYKRTKGKIREFRSIINMTGLDNKRLERQQISQLKRYKKNEQKIASDDVNLSTDNPAGGPYIPGDTLEFGKKKQQALDAVDEMMMLEGVLQKLPLASPMRGARTTSGFGYRVDPINRRAARHTGLDFAGSYGSKIYATSSGTVIHAGSKGAYGNTIEVSHGFGLTTRFAHLSSIRVKQGQWVSKGQLIGIQGSTGRSTGHHLHYEVRLNNEPLNPKRFLKAGQEYVQK
jgi:murein DD-endopeptidase MepM/ murein hydrolase activator NlpD